MSPGFVAAATVSVHFSDKPCRGVPAAVEHGVSDAGAVVEVMSAFSPRKSNMAPRADDVSSCGTAGDAFFVEVGGASLRCSCGPCIATCVSPEEAAAREASGCVASIPEAADLPAFGSSDTPVNTDVTGEPGAAGATFAFGDASAGGPSTASVVVSDGGGVSSTRVLGAGASAGGGTETCGSRLYTGELMSVAIAPGEASASETVFEAGGGGGGALAAITDVAAVTDSAGALASAVADSAGVADPAAPVGGGIANCSESGFTPPDCE